MKKSILNLPGVVLFVASALQALNGQTVAGLNDSYAKASVTKNASGPKALEHHARDVNVVNTPNVNVANTPTVTVGNSPSVNVTNTPNVNITNTSTQPVLNRSIDDPGRLSFQQKIVLSDACSGSTGCVFTFQSVPLGHRLVIQHISGALSYSGTPSFIAVSLISPNSGVLSQFFAPLVVTGTGTSFTAFDQPVLAYIDPTLEPKRHLEVIVELGPGKVATGEQVMNMSGYMLDCTAAPCTALLN